MATKPKIAAWPFSVPSAAKLLSFGTTTNPKISTLIKLGRIQPTSKARPPPRAL
ncbi:hypothetical protein RKD37_000867 [Streptomyces ambofaciens]